jgi:hypothetical protein
MKALSKYRVSVQTGAGLTNEWHVRPKWHTEKFPWHPAFTLSQSFFFFCPTSVSLLWGMCIYIHKSKYVEEFVYVLPLLSKLASETVLHKSVAVWSVDWIFIIGMPALRWVGEYVTLDKILTIFFSSRKKQQPQYLPNVLSYRNPRGEIY